MNKRLFQEPITAQTNKFHGMRIGRSTAPGPSNTVDQASWRDKYAACVVSWNALTPEQQAAYQDDADKRKITAFNQFMSVCLLIPTPPPGEWLGISSENLDSFCGEYPAFPLSGALDGTERWLHFVNETHWFVIDLGMTYTITKVRGRSWLGADPTDVDIYVSDDQNEWGAPVATGINTWRDTDVWQVVDCTEKNGRYIRVVINDTEHGSRFIAFGQSSPDSFKIFDAYGRET